MQIEKTSIGRHLWMFDSCLSDLSFFTWVTRKSLHLGRKACYTLTHIPHTYICTFRPWIFQEYKKAATIRIHITVQNGISTAIRDLSHSFHFIFRDRRILNTWLSSKMFGLAQINPWYVNPLFICLMLRFSPYLLTIVLQKKIVLERKEKKKNTLHVNFTTEYIIRRKTTLPIVSIGNTIFLGWRILLIQFLP